MKTAMKKVLSLSLVLVLLLGAFPMAAFATENGEDAAAADAGIAPADAGIAPADAGIMIPSEDDQDFEIPDGTEEQQPAELKLNKDDGKDKRPDKDDNKRPGKDEDKRPDKDEDKRPDKDDDKEEPVAPTSLTVNFYVDNALVETVTHNAAASIQELINACCTVDDSMTVYYSGARVNSNPCDLGDVVALGQEAHIYLYTKTAEPEPAPTPDPQPTVCSVCKDEVINGMCTGCYLDEADCTCAQTATPDNDRGKYTLILDYNYRGAKKTTMKVEPEASIKELIASIPAPTRDGHQFSHWTMDAAGADKIDEEVVTKKGTTIYAQWDDDLAVGGKLTLRVDLNYDHKMGEEIINIKKGTKMSDVLDYVPEPTRWKYKFDGWYWDRKCTEDVSSDDRIYNNSTIYAKWERRKTNNEIMLKVYLNGNTKSVAKVVDMYDYSRDGKISISEVKEAVSAYYTGKDAHGLEFSGLFEAEGWSEYVANRKHAKGEKRIVVNQDEDTTVYVMVYNAKVRTSSSSGTADTSNPKTGDMIFTAVTVMGASAACLAALLYLNKKRSF